jgi:hypothetical protein
MGLGLNLVAAVAQFHEFRLTIAPDSGCVVAEIVCPQTIQTRCHLNTRHGTDITVPDFIWLQVARTT